VQAAQVLITSGSQQGLDLVAKVMLERGTSAAVEAPTYLGALQAFAPYEPDVATVPCDALGPLPDALTAARGARLLYLLPNFQNPTGRCIPADRRVQIVQAAQALRLPLLEDDPYGDLWFEAPPPPPLATLWPEGTVYLGSFSKILAPGLRLGYVVAPPPLFDRLVQAKQAADLHSSTFAQHLVYEVLQSGMLHTHLARARQSYRARRDAMSAALERHLRGLAQWVVPGGGMFFWLQLPPRLDAAALLPLAVAQGVSFVPGAAFFAGAAQHHTLRLSFVTETPQRIEQGVAALAAVVHAACEATAGRPAADAGVVHQSGHAQ
jgi:2-aminoadipate transaminase